MNFRLSCALLTFAVAIALNCRQGTSHDQRSSRSGADDSTLGNGWGQTPCGVMTPRGPFLRRIRGMADIRGQDPRTDSVVALLAQLADTRGHGDTLGPDCVLTFLWTLDDLAADALERAGLSGSIAVALGPAIRDGRVKPDWLVPPARDWLRLTTERRLWVVKMLADAATPSADSALLDVALTELPTFLSAFSDTVLVPSERTAAAGYGLWVNTFIFVETAHRLALRGDASALRTIASAAARPKTLQRYVTSVLRDACFSTSLSGGNPNGLLCY